MTTTLADLLAGVDMVGGESFCDSIYNFLKNQGKDLNLLTNSGFGVWSQSDTNKGLCILAYDNGNKNGGAIPSVGDTCVGATSGTGIIISYTTTGDWDAGTAEGVFVLGACTGSWLDNDVLSLGGVEVARVNGEAVAICNDPCQNNGTGDWTDPDGILADNVGEYTVTTDANNEKAYLTGLTFTEGKIYKVEAALQDGTASPTDVELVSLADAVVEEASKPIDMDGWATYSLTFEATANTNGVGIRTPTSLGGNNIQMKWFICYEITPCCTGDADNKAFDGWWKDESVDIYRQHWDATYSKCGSFYSLMIVPTAADDYVRFPSAIYNKEEWYKQFCGRTVTVGAWVYASLASHAKLVIQQTSGDTDSEYHTGTPGWEWLEVTEVIATDTIFFDIQLFCDAAPNVDGASIVYISQPMLVFGSSLGEGMYQPKPQEIIYLEQWIASNILTRANWNDTGAFINLNLEADVDAILPKGAKAVQVYSGVKDSGSLGADCFLIIIGGTTSGNRHANAPYGKTNNTINRQSASFVVCDSNGDIAYLIVATGIDTFEVESFHYMAVQVN